MHRAMILTLLLTLVSAATPQAALGDLASRVEQFDQPAAVVYDDLSGALTDRQIETLRLRDGERARVWVFFDDKDIANSGEFDRRAAQVALTDRALNRRKKVDRSEVVFADLPVVERYVEAVERLGATHRRSSRWLNAATYEVDLNQVDAIAALPFVSAVRPMIVYRKPNLEASALRDIQPPSQAQAADVLDYGNSESQLNQINVPALHDQGLDGSGVTLAIFDTGFRKTHMAFAHHYVQSRVLAEWDFIFDDGNTANESDDVSSQWNHGTYIWSTSAGYLDGECYGPAYKANFILCKTEDVRSETQVEEDNWVAALEWVDSIGADVVTSSLSYHEWDDGSGYTFEDQDGWTGVTSAAASMAASMGIVVCNSAGNSGPWASSCWPPADAHDILAIGAVDSDNDLASFSSRGPTYDGRTKPEVLAQGVSTFCATATNNSSYGYVNGTSLSTPLVAGAACLLVQANPDWTPLQIREALMMTADNASSPDNDRGWGLIDAAAAAAYGANFVGTPRVGEPPLTVEFTDSSGFEPTAWLWEFGDGDTSSVQHPTHEYTETGVYDVSLEVNSEVGVASRTEPNYIVVIADTVKFANDSIYPGTEVALSVNLTNTVSLDRMVLPFRFGPDPEISLDSVSLGSRTAYFEGFDNVAYNHVDNRYAWELTADAGGGSPALEPGNGEVMVIYLSVSTDATVGGFNPVDSAANAKTLELFSPYATYEPVTVAGGLYIMESMRGDVNGDTFIDIADLVYLVTYMFQFGPPPVSTRSSDIDGSGSLDIADVVYLVDWMFNEGPPPPA